MPDPDDQQQSLITNAPVGSRLRRFFGSANPSISEEEYRRRHRLPPRSPAPAPAPASTPAPAPASAAAPPPSAPSPDPTFGGAAERQYQGPADPTFGGAYERSLTGNPGAPAAENAQMGPRLAAGRRPPAPRSSTDSDALNASAMYIAQGGQPRNDIERRIQARVQELTSGGNAPEMRPYYRKGGAVQAFKKGGLVKPPAAKADGAARPLPPAKGAAKTPIMGSRRNSKTLMKKGGAVTSCNAPKKMAIGGLTAPPRQTVAKGKMMAPKAPRPAAGMAARPKMPGAPAFKRGGKVPAGKWEGSKTDLAQDKKLAAKRGMSYESWEKSAGDVKHDKQQSMKGLARGGGVEIQGKTKGKLYARGGGVEVKGKTRGQMLRIGGLAKGSGAAIKGV